MTMALLELKVKVIGLDYGLSSKQGRWDFDHDSSIEDIF